MPEQAGEVSVAGTPRLMRPRELGSTLGYRDSGGSKAVGMSRRTRSFDTCQGIFLRLLERSRRHACRDSPA